MQEPKKGKPKFQQKPRPPVLYNFDFDPEKISIKTHIPDFPQKLKAKPDEKVYDRKLKQLKEKLAELKKVRKQKKAQYSKSGLVLDEEIKQLEENIELGNKCIQVLQSDLNDLEHFAAEYDDKISKKIRLIQRLRRGGNPKAKEEQAKKQYQQMTYQQLEQTIERLEIRVSTANLSKKQETELNSLINKLKRFKMKAPHGDTPKNYDMEIVEAQEALEKLKAGKRKQQNKMDAVRNKIECITEDIDRFQEQLEEIEEKKRNPEINELKEEANKLKENIYTLREQIAEHQQNFINRKHEYEYEQTKIQWIKFATKIKDEKIAEWEEEKRRRKQADNQKKGKGDDTTKESDIKPNFPQKTKINRHQKEIDACTFLIDYCNGLYPKNAQNTKQNTQHQEVDLTNALKKGEWAKEKGVEVIKPKKAVEDEPVKQEKNRKRKNKRAVVEEEEAENDNKFQHTIFVENIFDSIKAIPPVNAEDLEKSIQQLKEKLEYYLEHPQGSAVRQQKETPKRGYIQDKYKKANYNQNKKIINTEDFPALP